MKINPTLFSVKFYLLIALSSFICISATPPLNNLVVERGQVLNIPPRLYQYDTIHIKEAGVLKVNDNGSKWLVLKARVIICEGSIVYTNFRRGVGTIALTLENGEKLEHTYSEALGGSGGNGSGNGRQQGGLGHRTNDYNGGGGGSGAFYTGRPSVNLPGIAATDFRGAPSPSSSRWCFGGNGARQSYGHGGLICILADKIVFGSTAKIQLRGSDGSNGTNGGTGDCYGGGQVYYWGGGGGGGGTSGGNGGVLVVKCSDIANMPTVDVGPGKGGKGGAGGRSARCSFHGQGGMHGDDGEQGYADWQ
ncbi:hypothetical protein L0U88_01650 [Flavihumibacter sp. RY-1]|uniref:Glycine rich protein n=1 Tax=Flavihumibacter fluminis TaxID=2909236 RepID=A0ABS9BCS5_9BACT|nr:hypothetical protein [Flavihumibacter fluminis]MCF1713330.1 hypothetical protein [Flavihumibacter fluminis]